MSDLKVITILNVELADKLGNLLSRCTGIAINSNQVFPPFCEEIHNTFGRKFSEDLISSLKDLPGEEINL